MSKTIIYYMSAASPYCYLGGPRLVEIAAGASAGLVIKPIDTSKSFPATGGLPVKKRHPSRLAYRLVELARWRDHFGLPMNIEPKFFPVDAALAARMIIAAKQADFDAVALSVAIGRATWEAERNIADPAALQEIAEAAGSDGAGLLEASGGDPVEAEFVANTDEAMAKGVFGVPWLDYNDVPYWGQDRLDFLARAVAG